MLVDSRSIIYIIVFLVFLEGCSSDNIRRYHSKCASHSTNSDATIFYISQDKKTNIRHSQQTPDVTNIHKYNHTNYSSYHKSTYTVKSGDTLFYIAWITGNSWLNLAKTNNIKDVNALKVNQVLIVHHNTMWLYFEKFLREIFIPFNSGNNIFKKILFFVKKQLFYSRAYNNTYPNMETSCNMMSRSTASDLVTVKDWYWPTNGTIINTFSDVERGNKGIDISGTLGQPILAAANGKVVYIGNTLKGYGNLIILKHDNNYLSAYAHNDMILVAEQQTVKMGDKIATMGNSGTNEVKLHFEIRYKGKSVDPLCYLQNR
ncbi:peptidoglycan DD-metalloendopeptidase family protein [Blochmannia endosymbiont of Camponotus sp.]|uniref:peptidoglycan DD-metalloendopeptidase family protein n=1 Tax=Blochmannia endosymbiont of Camponotus sp. TaxID=700220 RepID=UPI002024004F|nr:peptidoglycan DD-metalloendopeptidase family protein [Blochmannia endosymbiont of Camponotus sp.]URJ25719.1 peptidoglycan DD-metalloendopeptidase family protein [Blochmannia endosymbiont of Camponotus sp.]